MATILWRDPSLVDVCYSSEGINTKILLFDFHDTILPEWIAQIRPKLLGLEFRFLVKSNFHAKILGIDGDPHTVVIPNSIPNSLGSESVRIPRSLLCTSSPDRCLGTLLAIAREIPDIKIYWAYGGVVGDPQGMQELERLGTFVNLGSLAPQDLAPYYQSADLFVYGTTFPEIDCVSMSKAMLAGAIPVVTRSGALGEKCIFGDIVGDTEVSINEKR